MPISWKTSDGNTGIAENAYEFAMQHSNTEAKSDKSIPLTNSSTKGDREELAPQDRINQAFGEGPTPEVKDQNDPLYWGLGGVLKQRKEEMQPPKPDVFWKNQLDEIESEVDRNPPGIQYDVKADWHNQLASFQQRLDTTPPEEAGAFRKFLGSLNIMPAPGKPESEWTAKEHFGVLLNTAMAGMGGGYRMPRMTGPGIGGRSPASFDYPMDFKDYYPANNMNKPSGQIDQPGLDAFVNNLWEGLRKQFTPGTYEHAVANQIAQKGKLKIVPKEENLTTETEPQLQQAQHGGSIEQVSNPAIRIEGEVYHAPGTHGDAYMKAIEAYGPGAKIPKGEEGFITTHGRFVDRVEAGEIALKAKQVGLRIGRLDTDNFDPAPPPSKTLEWPEGWGTKLPEDKRILSASDYPHIQKAFKEAVEQGNKTSSEVSDYILEKHGIDLSSYMVKRLQETSGVKLEDKIINATNSGWTPELIGKLKEGFDKGKSFQTLADELGQSRGQVAGKVSRLLKEGVLVDRPTMTSGVEANPEKMARFKELRSKGLSYKEIAQDLNITTSYARVIASRNKI